MKEKEANLGCATTREMLIELSTRGRVAGGSDGEYLEKMSDLILTHLNSESLNYRTIDDN